MHGQNDIFVFYRDFRMTNREVTPRMSYSYRLGMDVTYASRLRVEDRHGSGDAWLFEPVQGRTERSRLLKHWGS